MALAARSELPRAYLFDVVMLMTAFLTGSTLCSQVLEGEVLNHLPVLHWLPTLELKVSQ